MYFAYRKGSGIMHYLYKRYKGNISLYLKTKASYETSISIENVFDFNDDTYWITNNYAPDGNYLEFCFPHHMVKITDYEIKAGVYTNNGSPFKWGFSADSSNEKEVITTHTLAQGETYHVRYAQNESYNCFRYINRGYISAKEGVFEGYRSRIAHIEIYGHLYGDGQCFGTNKVRKHNLFHLITS